MDGHALYLKTLAEFSRVIDEAEKAIENEERSHVEAIRMHDLKISQLRDDVASAHVAKFHVAKAYREYAEAIKKSERTAARHKRTKSPAAKSTAGEGGDKCQ